jgi:hypothetical protein
VRVLARGTGGDNRFRFLAQRTHRADVLHHRHGRSAACGGGSGWGAASWRQRGQKHSRRSLQGRRSGRNRRSNTWIFVVRRQCGSWRQKRATEQSQVSILADWKESDSTSKEKTPVNGGER